MDNFYFFTIFVGLTAIFSERLALVSTVIGVFVFLNVLPDTGFDYIRYQLLFESAYVVNEFPFFLSERVIDSEPLYLWYNSVLSYLLNKDFPLFLGVNFLISFLISFVALNDFPRKYFYIFWLFMLPIIVPTVFYYSPRSSISFFFILFAFVSLIKERWLLCLLLILCGVSFHSQYILQSVLMFSTFFILRWKFKFDVDKSIKTILLFSGILVLFLVFINNFSNVLVSLLAFLPSADIATAKLHYLESSREGFRLTSILSIFVYPILSFGLLRYISNKNLSLLVSVEFDKILFIMLFAIVCYGAATNIAYFNNPHLAGRLSRFSDYLGLGLVLPFYLMIIKSLDLLYFVFFLLVVSVPFLFPTLYHNVSW